MYVVIFRATVALFDDEYFQMAAEMKELAFSKYGCLDFVSVTENDEEIAISYWDTMQQISDWKNDPQHMLAQQAGRNKWYASYRVEICELKRIYGTDKPEVS